MGEVDVADCNVAWEPGDGRLLLALRRVLCV
jgi:hypothetical protein